MVSTREGSKGLLAAALGAGIGGTGVFVAISLINPTGDVTTGEFLTLGQYADLELEGVSILAALALATITSIAGVWISLWLRRYPYAFVTTLLFGPLLILGGMLVAEGFDSWPVWPAMALWPFVAGLTARALVAGLAEHLS